MALASEQLMTREAFDSLISAMSKGEGMAEYISEIDALRTDWLERERYITEEAVPGLQKYDDLVEKYRARFNEGLKVGIEDTDVPESETVEYSIDDLYSKEG